MSGLPSNLKFTEIEKASSGNFVVISTRLLNVRPGLLRQVITVSEALSHSSINLLKVELCWFMCSCIYFTEVFEKNAVLKWVLKRKDCFAGVYFTELPKQNQIRWVQGSKLDWTLPNPNQRPGAVNIFVCHQTVTQSSDRFHEIISTLVRHLCVCLCANSINLNLLGVLYSSSSFYSFDDGGHVYERFDAHKPNDEV